MNRWILHAETLEVPMKQGVDIRDITAQLGQAIQASGVRTGTLNVTVVGSTGSVTTIEYEPGVVEDLKRAIERLAPPGLDYEHEKAWHDGNGHSHVQAALLGPSVALPVRRGRLVLGTWQQVVLINHDNRSRSRRVEVTVMGTG
ncbi:secondary thiamine-phosphate synthase enzyme [Desulfacinum hydrothermale DSM 13146]|uniref:Secondary thiamine-phosphate synthase enzyme n=1 Tax=Desulfacinum hydrothermale DSM 13146 TaxID=1121390 RepID=A0A1W1X056_9BACT|nr:secondary thiamine-phosphate synthase enzyme YjbQ [Desulfacinum hydrothermale]SMC17267.1 secondary thiamine-phosphate synthase enzyme [Desulfacinum hydrothermale DSM 13146]